jgi:hypothetical protein
MFYSPLSRHQPSAVRRCGLRRARNMQPLTGVKNRPFYRVVVTFMLTTGNAMNDALRPDR